MSYVTQDQLEKRFGTALLIDLTDRGEIATGEIDVDTVTSAIEDTAALIDGNIAPRYALPVKEVPPLLRDIALTIALWKLYTTEPNQKTKDDYAAAMKTLTRINDGSVKLPLPSGSPSQGTGSSGARVTDRQRPMTDTKLAGFI